MKKSRPKLWVGYLLTITILAGVLAAFVYIINRDPYDSYATATVVGIDTVQHEGIKNPLPEDIFFDFRFGTAKGEIVHFSQSKGLYTGAEYQLGQTMRVNYDSKDPQQVVIPDPNTKKDWIQAAAFGWVAISLFLILVFYLIGKGRRKEQQA